MNFKTSRLISLLFVLINTDEYYKLKFTSLTPYEKTYIHLTQNRDIIILTWGDSCVNTI